MAGLMEVMFERFTKKQIKSDIKEVREDIADLLIEIKATKNNRPILTKIT